MDPNRPQSQLQPDLSPYQPQRQNLTGTFTRAWSTAEITLISLSVASCAIVLGISISLAVDPAVQSYIAVWTAPQAGVALVWSAIELIATFAGRKSVRKIHPGARAAVQLLLWLGFGVATGLTAYILAFAIVFVSFDDRDTYPEYYEYYHGHGSNRSYEYYSKSYIRSMEALVAFLALLIVLHFLLFIRACAEAVKRRRADSVKVAAMELEEPGQKIQERQPERPLPTKYKGESNV